MPLALSACSGNETHDIGSAEIPASQEQSVQVQETPAEPVPSDDEQPAEPAAFDLSQISAYADSPYAIINDNAPTIGRDGIPTQGESYAPLDDLGRCGAAIAVVSPSTMPA